MKETKPPPALAFYNQNVQGTAKKRRNLLSTVFSPPLLPALLSYVVLLLFQYIGQSVALYSATLFRDVGSYETLIMRGVAKQLLVRRS